MAGRDSFIGRDGSGSSLSFPTISTGASGLTPAGGMDLGALTAYINNLNLNAQAAANKNRIPGDAALESQSSANIGNELHGILPPDVLRLIQQQGAERGVATGSPGSPNSNAAYLQALGLTSLGLQEQGQHDLSGAVARNPAAPIFDPTSQLMTPYQSSELALQQQAERDRVQLEQQRLALDAAHVGGGGGGGGGRGGAAPAPVTPFDPMVYSTRTGTGATASDLADTFTGNPTQEWWNSIGFTPGTGATPGSGRTFIGSDYIDPTLFDSVGTGTATGGGGDVFAQLSQFAQDMGVDPTLYSGGE